MLKRPTIPVVSSVAAALTDNRLVLTPKSDHYPVGVMASQIRTAVDADYCPFTRERGQKINTLIEKANQTTSEGNEEEFDQLTDLMAQGLKRMLTQVRGVVVPVCKRMKEDYDTIGDHQRVPKLEVKPFVFHEIHNDPTLTTHILEGYCNQRPKESYRSFIIDRPSVETLVEWIADNKHVDAKTTTEWLLAREDHEFEIGAVWDLLFGHRREITLSDISFASRGNLPFCLDQILIAYLLTAYLCKEPQDVAGESVSIDEWHHGMSQLHSLMGALLCQAYEFRAKARERERVVFRYDVERDARYGNDMITVHVNGDIYTDWLEQGGDIEVLLGAAVEAPTRMHAKDLEEAREELVRRWKRRHHLIRQTAMDRFLKKRRDNLRMLLVDAPNLNDQNDELSGALPSIGYNELVERASKELKALREEHFDDPWRTIVRLVCRVYYPNTPYEEFLTAMDRMAKVHGDIPARELATLATVEMTAQWLAKQIRSEPFTPDIREVADSEVVTEHEAENPAQEPERGEDVSEEEADVTTDDEEKAEESETHDDTVPA